MINIKTLNMWHVNGGGVFENIFLKGHVVAIVSRKF